MAISKKKREKKASSKEAWKVFREGILKQSGYVDLKRKHGKSARHEIPSYKIESKLRLSDKVGNGFKKKTAGQHEDAITFPVYDAHKSNSVLMLPSDDTRFSGGKKT